MRFLPLLIVFAALPALAAPPSIASLSSSSVPRSGRFEILGAGFGERPLAPDTRVEIGGVPAATATWTDGKIVAYVNRAIPIGPASLRVVTAEGASADVPFEVLPLPVANGAVAWTFVANGTSSWNRPAVGPDGRVYAGDDRGFIYALDADGELAWIRHGPSVGGYGDFYVGSADDGTLAVGEDGTIYVAVNLLGPDLQIQAYRPDGTLAWIYTDTGTLSHGLQVGPDGNIFFSLAPFATGGLRILEPGGNLVGSETENVATGVKYDGIRGAEITFGPSTRGGPLVRLYLVSTFARDDDFSRGSLQAHALDGPLEWARNACGYERNPGHRTYGYPAVTRDGDVLLTGTRGPGMPLALHRLAPSGDLVWTYDPVSSIRITEAEADPSGGAYVVTNTRFLHSVGEGGARRWVREIVGQVDYGPIVHPDGESAVVVATGVEGTRLVSVKPEGALGWQIPLPSIDGVVPTPTSRLRVAGSGGRVYLPTLFLGSDDRWALYAIDTPASQEEGTGGTWGDGGSGDGAGGTGGSGGDDGLGGTGGDAGLGGTGGSGGSAPGASGSGHASRPTGGCTTSGSQGPTLLALAIAVSLAAARRRSNGAYAMCARTPGLIPRSPIRRSSGRTRRPAREG